MGGSLTEMGGGGTVHTEHKCNYDGIADTFLISFIHYMLAGEHNLLLTIIEYFSMTK